MTSANSARNDREPFEPALKRRLMLGLGIVILLCATVAGWAANAQLTGAVIAPGHVVIDSRVKKVQHQTGGIVGDILVKAGGRVKAGDVVLRLDETQVRANLGIITSQLTQLTGRAARLMAERDDRDAPAFPEGFTSGDRDVQSVIDGETRLFNKRRAALGGQKSQLKERIGQLQREIEGLSAQSIAKDQEIDLMQAELRRVETMRKKELVPVQRLLSTQRDLARLNGERGVLTAQIAKAYGVISETGLQIFGLDQMTQSEANKELREIEARIAELSERRISAEDMLRRVELRAPHSGTVHELNVHTVGGVIGAGETVMSIVPDDDKLEIEVRIAPNDIDQVSIGQSVTLRFSAFNQSTTPEIKGVVAQRSVEISKDPQTGHPYYFARVSIDDSERMKIMAERLVSGMPVEGFIETSQRTALSFLMKPVTDQFKRAFREN